MICQRCGSPRVLDTHAHASDCQNYSVGDKEYVGYAPTIPDICDSDELFPSICLQCGQVQGEFPKKTPSELEQQDEDNCLQLINGDFLDWGAFQCYEAFCPYRTECANHESAGDYRSEDGFTPEVTLVDGHFYCKTYNREPLGDERWDSDFPCNEKSLNRGMLTTRNISRD